MELYTVLTDRTLWFDGDSTVSSDNISRWIDTEPSKNIYVNHLTKDIIQYNKLVPTSAQITVKTEVREFDLTWNIPDEFKQLNIDDFIYDKLFRVEKQERLTEDQMQLRMKRVSYELSLFYKHKLHDVIRTIIYIIHTFTQKGIVWGVGRGSSVSSYILYLIGVHDIDSVEYELDILEFLH
jgi:DNA polymerase III alpha subunit